MIHSAATPRDNDRFAPTVAATESAHLGDQHHHGRYSDEDRSTLSPGEPTASNSPTPAPYRLRQESRFPPRCSQTHPRSSAAIHRTYRPSPHPLQDHDWRGPRNQVPSSQLTAPATRQSVTKRRPTKGGIATPKVLIIELQAHRAGFFVLPITVVHGRELHWTSAGLVCRRSPSGDCLSCSQRLTRISALGGPGRCRHTDPRALTGETRPIPTIEQSCALARLVRRSELTTEQRDLARSCSTRSPQRRGSRRRRPGAIRTPRSSKRSSGLPCSALSIIWPPDGRVRLPAPVVP